MEQQKQSQEELKEKERVLTHEERMQLMTLHPLQSSGVRQLMMGSSLSFQEAVAKNEELEEWL